MRSIRNFLIQIAETLDSKEWNLKKISLILVIFAMPLGPLALVLYFCFRKIMYNNK